MRIREIDGLRGLCLILMTISHLNAVLLTDIGRLPHALLGFSDAAHGFVLLSGCVVALVYGRKLRETGARAMTSALLLRMRVIWLWHAALLVASLAAILLCFTLFGSVPGIFARLTDAPISLSLATLGLVAAPPHMGILPMYLWLMALTPLWLVAFQRGWHGWVLAVSALVWGIAQTPVSGVLADQVAGGLARLGYHGEIGLYFNLLGWQALFVAGLMLGDRIARRPSMPLWLSGPSRRMIMGIALTGFVLLGGLDLSGRDLGFLEQRASFGILHVLSVLDMGVLILLGLTSPRLSSHLRAVLCAPGLVRMGARSLTLFALHLPLVYAVTVLAEYHRFGSVSAHLVLIAGPMALWAIAFVLERKSAAQKTATTTRRVQAAA